MIKFERVVVALLVISLLLKFLQISGGAFLLLISSSVLSMFYFGLGVLLFLKAGIKRGEGFSSAPASGPAILAMIIASLGLAQTIIGSLFIILHYTGADSIILIGLATQLIALIILMIVMRAGKISKERYKAILFRLVASGLYGVFCFVVRP